MTLYFYLIFILISLPTLSIESGLLTFTVGPSSGKNEAAALSRRKRSKGAAAARSARDASKNLQSWSSAARARSSPP